MTKRRELPLGVVLSRMTSQRLPGKALLPIGKRPLLEWVLESLKRCTGLSEVIVAISTEHSDDPLFEWCTRNNYKVFRGPLQDVPARILGAAEWVGVRDVVRISGDSPFIFPPIVDFLVDVFRSDRYDLVTNVFPRTFPKGQSVEILHTGVLRSINSLSHDPSLLEHVTSLIYSNSGSWHIRNVDVAEIFPTNSDWNSLSKVDLCLDSHSDIERLECFLQLLPSNSPWEVDWDDYIRAIDELDKNFNSN